MKRRLKKILLSLDVGHYTTLYNTIHLPTGVLLITEGIVYFRKSNLGSKSKYPDLNLADFKTPSQFPFDWVGL